jgi:pyruvate ferredoxin oxidoreductase gamma subunit
MTEIRWHGRGGQGAKTVSRILAAAFLEAGKWVQAFPEFGPERSGAPVRAFNRIDDVPVRRRCAVTRPHAVVVLDASLCAEIDVTSGLGLGGLVLVNTEDGEETLRKRLGFAGRIVCVPADRLAAEAGSRYANVVMLGALARSLGAPPLEALRLAMVDTLAEKLPVEALAASASAMRAGYEAVEAGAQAGRKESAACPS